MTLLLALVLALPAAQGAAPVEFDARAAEHLANRAGFGADRAWIAAAVAKGRAGVLDELFAPRDVGPGRAIENLATGGVLAPPHTPEPAEAASMDEVAADGADMDREAARRREQNQRRAADRRQLAEYAGEWVAGMVARNDPLRDRMTLFWHGHFTSSMESVRSSHALIEQHRFLRENALGNFRTLLVGVLRDPAMLVYLDNQRNGRGRVNENLAREFLELFTLGEGHFSETDVREVARCFTGHTASEGAYLFRPGRHDRGEKVVLGRRGRFGPEDVVDIVLEHPRTAERIAWKLLRYFEGVEPDAERTALYAGYLQETAWEIAPVLRRLFEDPAFDRPELRGARIASPVDFVVGHSIRLGIEPSPESLLQAARLLGEWLFHPPSVKGWEPGPAWLTTTTALARANVAGLLAGAIGPGDLLAREGSDGSEARAPRDPVLAALGRSVRAGRRAPPDLAAACGGASDDAAIVDALLDALLAIEPSAATREALRAEFARDRSALGLPEGPPTSFRGRGPALLARLAHRILALPEANLH